MWQQWNSWVWYFEAEFPLISDRKMGAQCEWWSSDLPFHYFSANRSLLSLYQISFQAKAMQRTISQHKHFFVLDILKSLLIRYLVSHPHPGSLTWGIKSPLKVCICQWGQIILPNKASVLKVPVFQAFRRLLTMINSRLPWNFNYTCFILWMINESPTGTCMSIISPRGCDSAKCQQG